MCGVLSRSHRQRSGEQGLASSEARRSKDPCGGRRVAANSLLRRRLGTEGPRAGLRVVLPPLAYCTDNAAMIGTAALCGPRLDYPSYLGVDASASLPLGQWLPGVSAGLDQS